jgi:hypothetical protein
VRGGLERETNGFQIAHLAHQDDVRVLAERRAEGARERQGVGPHLAVRDEAPLALVDELEGIFDRDDVIGALAVGMIHHRGEGGGLAAAGGPRDEHQSLREHGGLLDDRRQAERVGIPDAVGNQAERGPQPWVCRKRLTR